MLKDLVIRNRSYRTYDHDLTLDKKELIELIDTARLTPSAMNRQPLLYVPLEKEKADMILPYTGWARALDIKLPPDGRGPSAFILVCTDTDKYPDTASAMRDVGIVSQTILLGAVEKGLGGCMLGSFDENEIKEKLGLSENIRILLCIAIGKPDETVTLEEVGADGSISYWRDEDMVHHVPKRKLCDIVIDI